MNAVVELNRFAYEPQEKEMGTLHFDLASLFRFLIVRLPAGGPRVEYPLYSLLPLPHDA